MMGDVDEVIRELDAMINSATAARDRLRAAAREPDEPGKSAVIDEHGRRMLKMMPVVDAARLSGLSKSRIRALCSENIFVEGGSGFGYRCAGRWHVVSAPFLAHCASRRRFKR